MTARKHTRAEVAMAGYSALRPWLRDGGRVKGRCWRQSRDVVGWLAKHGVSAHVVVIYSSYQPPPVKWDDSDRAEKVPRASPWRLRGGMYLAIFRAHYGLARHYVVCAGKTWIDPTIAQFFGCDDVPLTWREP